MPPGTEPGPHWHMKSLRALHRERPFIVPLLCGFLFISVADELTLHPAISTALVLLGECLLVYAIARRVHVSRLGRYHWLRIGLWISNAAIGAMFVVSAFDSYRTLVDPNRWLQVEGYLFRVSEAEPWLKDGEFLLNLDPGAEFGFEQIGQAGIDPGPVRRLLNQQIAIGRNAEFSDDCCLILLQVSNQGLRTISSLQLRVRIEYEGRNDPKARVPPEKSLDLPLRELAPGQSFFFLPFSTNPRLYATAYLPQVAYGRRGNSTAEEQLKINYPDKEHRHFLGNGIVTHGIETHTKAPKTVSVEH